MSPWVAAGLVALALVLLAAFAYNRLVTLRNRVEAAWADLDVQLTRRHELIPNLVETVRAYAEHERLTFESVVAARAAAERARSRGEKASAEAEVADGLSRLVAVAEAYPELKADARFRELQLELVATEDKLAFSRQLYNDTVNDFADTAQSFPMSLLAGPLGFRVAEPFTARDDQRAAVAVDLDARRPDL